MRNRIIDGQHTMWAGVRVKPTVNFLIQHVEDCTWWILVLLPSTCTRDWEVVDDATRTIFAGC